MPHAQPAAAPYLDGTDRDHFPLRRRELALIAAFWLLLAIVTAASRLWDPRGPGPRGTMVSGFVWLPFVESVLWTLLTPPIFVLASRHGGGESRPLVRALLFVGAVLGAALLVNVAATAFRFEFFPPRSGRGGGRGGAILMASGRPLLERFALIDDLITAAAILVAGLARDYSLRLRAREEQATRLQAQLAEARLDALRRQLDPHFLFNTLNAVSALVERDPRGVRRMISRLSELLRHSMEGAQEPELVLDRELELLQRYVDIMQVRFQGRLEVALHADERARRGLVPNMILQPLVENAIRHGVGQREGTGHISVRAAVEGDLLVVRVEDDGVGLPGDAAVEAPRGVGLRNTRERLAQLYGERGRFALRAREGGGTIAELTLPWHVRAVDGAPVPTGGPR